MKKYWIIILMALAACNSLKNSKADRNIKTSTPLYRSLEKFNGDTLQFVKSSILERKEKYIGKELNILLKDLQIPVMKYLSGSTHSNRFVSPYIYINIYSNTQQEFKIANRTNPIQISVTWKTPLPSEETNKLVVKSQLNWTPEVAEYYGKQIVGDVGIVQYNFK